MKKQLLSVIASVALAGGVSAQWFIPNPGFESWGSSFGEPQQPQGWISPNILASPLISAQNPTVVSQAGAPDNYQGTYSCKITTASLVSNPDPANIPNTSGYCLTGGVQLVNPYFRPGYAFAMRPQSLSYYAKYTPVSGDTAFCAVVLTKWNTTNLNRDTIAVGYDVYTNASTTYSQHTVTLMYNTNNNNLQPDTCLIWFSASSNWAPQVGSTLFIDDVNFSGYVGMDENAAASKVSVYPNPSGDFTYIDVTDNDAKEVVVYDMSGREVRREKFELKKAEIPSWMLATGVYNYSVVNANNEILHRGKFAVAH